MNFYEFVLLGDTDPGDLRATGGLVADTLADALDDVLLHAPIGVGDRLGFYPVGCPALWYRCTGFALENGAFRASWRLLADGAPLLPAEALLALRAAA